MMPMSGTSMNDVQIQCPREVAALLSLSQRMAFPRQSISLSSELLVTPATPSGFSAGSRWSFAISPPIRKRETPSVSAASNWLTHSSAGTRVGGLGQRRMILGYPRRARCSALNRRRRFQPDRPPWLCTLALPIIARLQTRLSGRADRVDIRYRQIGRTNAHYVECPRSAPPRAGSRTPTVVRFSPGAPSDLAAISHPYAADSEANVSH